MEQYDTAIIGNGFDLYYNQPTKYEHFFMFLSDFQNYKSSDFFNNCNPIELSNLHSELLGMVKDNFFYNYFLEYNNVHDSWSAFEEELLFIIKSFNEIFNGVEKTDFGYLFYEDCENICIDLRNIKINSKFKEIFNVLPNCRLYNYISANINGFIIEVLDIKIPLKDLDNRKIKDRIKKYVKNFPREIFNELEKFCNVFKLYLGNVIVVDKLKSINKSLTVQNIVNYNYTHLAQKLFKPEEEMCYIHGEINKKIVLGIDSSNKELNRFSYFFKDIQRISCETDYNKLNLISNETSSLVIIGHSLNEADDDSLKILLGKEDYIKITVFYYHNDKFASSDLASNLRRILGEKKFNRFIYSNILEFKPLPID